MNVSNTQRYFNFDGPKVKNYVGFRSFVEETKKVQEKCL